MEEFTVPYRSGANVLTCLMDIQKNPVTADGKQTTPVVWESSCLEEVCGACSMLVNCRVRQGCTALVDGLGDTITLEPMTKFPVIRDLVVDRSRMFHRSKRCMPGSTWTALTIWGRVRGLRLKYRTSAM